MGDIFPSDQVVQPSQKANLVSSPFPPSGNENPFSSFQQPGNTGFGGQPFGGQPPGGQQFGSPGYGFPPRQPTTLALPALFSLLLSVASPFFVCVCLSYLTPIVSLAGIVMGHIALVRIARSGGTKSGSGLAIGGLVIGYPMFLLGLMFWAILLMPRPKPVPIDENSPAARLNAAEGKINSDSDGIAHGNTPEAKALAEKYATTMKSLREAFFTKGKKGISLSGGNFITYCELHDGRCIFITHVPQYRKFTGDAKDSLAEIAWEAAQETVSDTLHEGDDLGVGLKGVVFYGSVMVGHVTSIGGDKRGLEKETESDKRLLEPFFERDEVEMPKEAPIKLDEPAKPEEAKMAEEPAANPDAKP
jgi:hypothetical protein